MKTRKTVITVLAVTLLVSAALIVGCMNQLDGLADKDVEDNYPIPEGKGIVRIKFVDSNAKTILPVIDLSSYLYDLVITRGGGGVTAINVTDRPQSYFLTGGAGYSIALPPANDYKISLTAKKSGVAVGGWNNDNNTFGVTSGNSTPLAAVLKATQGGQGTFTYNVKATTNGTTTINVFSDIAGTTSIGTGYYGHTSNDIINGGLGETASFPITVVIGTPETGTITLDSGYYLVKVTASLARYQTVQYVHVLHIYDGLDSSIEHDLSSITLSQNLFAVAYNLKGETDTSDTYGPGYVESDDVYYASLATDHGAPTFASNSFGGWYTDTNTTDGNEWAFTTRVINDVTLYAKVIVPGSNGTVAITITFPMVDSGNIIGTPTISRADIYAGNSLELKLPAGTWSNITWSIGGETISAGLSNTNGSANDTLNINNSEQFRKNFAMNSFQVSITGTLGGAPYSKTIPITVTP